MKMEVYKINNASSYSYSSSIGCLSSSDSVSSDVLELEEPHHVVDVDDEATSPFPSNGNIFELSDLMYQLPVKRGLSHYYNGKSDSFKNLMTLKSLEDVPKNRSHRTTLSKMKNQNKKKQENSKYSFAPTKSKISKTNSNKGSMKASILMKTWNVTSTSGLSNSSDSRFIHV